jgi:2-methylcitrate dehydratase PrpD
METFPMNDTGPPSRIGACRIGGMGSLTEALVDTLLSAYDDAGDSAHDAACRLLFDHWACRLGGDRALPVDWQPVMAARQAAAACQLDRDDVHWASMTHPGSIIWPTVLDVGLRTDADGAAVLRAAILGYEVCARIAEALGPSHRRGWHATATAGTVGAAMSAAVILGLDRPGIVTALGHAISVAGGSSRSVVERSATKVFHRAHAVTAGIACAEAAYLVPATREGLELPHGMLATMSSDAEPDRLIAPPREWAVERTAIRLHAASGFAHTAAEAAAQLAVYQDPGAITSVRLAVSAPTRALADIAEPHNDEDAWWSVQHAVAACLVHGDPAALDGGLQDDARVRSLLACTTFNGVVDGIGATVTVERADGSSQTATVELPTGHPDRPASPQQLLAKWAALTGRDGERAWAAANHTGSGRLRDTVQEAGLESA